MTRDRTSLTRISRRSFTAGAVALPLLALTPTLTQASLIPTGYLFVNLNVNGPNQVAGYAMNSGLHMIAPLPGSPFSVGGTGTGASLGSQGALQYIRKQTFLLVADAGSDQISVLSVRISDGKLTPVPGSPFSSGGKMPVSIAVHGWTNVYVANAGAGGSNYATFKLDPTTGFLTPKPLGVYPVPDGAGLGGVFVDATGTHLSGTRVASSLIDSLVITKGGRLVPAPGSPFPAQGVGPLGSTFAIAAPRLYASNAQDGPGLGTVSAFDVGADGTLTSIGSSPFPDQQTAPGWVAVSPDGLYLFAANAGSDSISSYSIGIDGSLTLIGKTKLRGGTGLGSLGTVDLGLHPTGKTLYVVDSAAHQISVLSNSLGVLHEFRGSPVPLPPGGAPAGIALGRLPDPGQ